MRQEKENRESEQRKKKKSQKDKLNTGRDSEDRKKNIYFLIFLYISSFAIQKTEEKTQKGKIEQIQNEERKRKHGKQRKRKQMRDDRTYRKNARWNKTKP